MTPFPVIPFFALLLGCQLAGEALVRGLSLPLSGPVMGMGLLFALMLARRGLFARVERPAMGLLGYLSLLFVPAGVGVVTSLELLSAHGLALLAVLVLSTVLAMAVGVGVYLAVQHLMGGAEDA